MQAPVPELAVNLTVVFRLSLYGLTALAGLMLALAEGTMFPSAWTLPVAALAFCLNETWPVIRIPTLWANLLGVGAVGFAVSEFFGESLEAQLLSGAHLLVYLTWVVLFQDKRGRQYWWLFGLGVLQVAIGAVLTAAGWYGALLITYLFLAIWTLSVFTRYLGIEEFSGENATHVAFSSLPQGIRSQFEEAPPNPVSALRRQLSLATRSTARSSVQYDLNDRWGNVRIVCGMIGMNILSLCLGLILFLVIPRLWLGDMSRLGDIVERGISFRTLTGFTEDVQLGDVSEMLESTIPVLRIRLFDNDTNEPRDLYQAAYRYGLAEPLFRGTVLDIYHHGRWTSGGLSGRKYNLDPKPENKGMLRQEISLDPIGTDVLFALPPYQSGGFVNRDQPISMSLETSALVWSPWGQRRELQYVIYSPPPELQMADEYAPPRPYEVRRRHRYLQLPETDLQRLVAHAQELSRPNQLLGTVDQTLARRIALTLEYHLRDSGSFVYSLNTAIQNPTVDPVEDFLFNRRAGHCEYFASALTLMLRAVGIPARIVSGFKGAHLNELGGYYEVQQRHAHVWVEAYVDKHWLLLDPTPAAREDMVASQSSALGIWNNIYNLLSTLWSNHVVALTINQQKREFYEPLQQSLKQSWTAVQDREAGLAGLFRKFKRQFRSPSDWISWRGGVVAFFLLLLVSAVVWVSRKLLAAVRRLRHGEADPQAGRPHIQFYEQFVSLMSSLGLERTAGQTPREFAARVETELAARLSPMGLQGIPARLIELFYRVRFGETLLAATEQSEVAADLQKLQSCLLANDAG